MKEHLTLLDYLNDYAHWQQDILLVSRKSTLSGFGRKALLNTSAFDPMEHYNHRNILDDEIVIEFDNEDPKKNGDSAGMVVNNLKKLRMSYSVWNSGGKSIHVHTHFDISQEYKNLRLIKRLLTAYLCQGVLDTPDDNLTVRRHLIRTEYGLHEKTMKFKMRLMETEDYPRLNAVPKEVKGAYDKYMAMPKSTDNPKRLSAAHPLVQSILNSHSIPDGRNALLWRLVNILKQDMPKDKVYNVLEQWYKNNKGNKMSSRDIKKTIDYHWDKPYSITEYSLSKVLKDLGITDKK